MRLSLIVTLIMLFQNNMRIYTTEPKRAYAGTQGYFLPILILQPRPLLVFFYQVKWRAINIYIRINSIKVQGFDELFMLELQHSFHKGSDARSNMLKNLRI